MNERGEHGSEELPSQGMTEDDLRIAARAKELERSQRLAELQYMPIDWDLDPAVIEQMTPEQLKGHLVVVNEQIRRVQQAIVAQAKRLAPLVDKEGDVPLDVETDMVMNPNNYRQTFESREDITE